MTTPRHPVTGLFSAASDILAVGAHAPGGHLDQQPARPAGGGMPPGTMENVAGHVPHTARCHDPQPSANVECLDLRNTAGVFAGMNPVSPAISEVAVNSPAGQLGSLSAKGINPIVATKWTGRAPGE